MNVASLELCKELYELSRWDDTYTRWIDGLDKPANADEASKNMSSKELAETDTWPAYTLGYLLRKLPEGFKYGLEYDFHLQKVTPQLYRVFYRNFETHRSVLVLDADTPEDAACRLAIELFKRGKLTKG